MLGGSIFIVFCCNANNSISVIEESYLRIRIFTHTVENYCLQEEGFWIKRRNPFEASARVLGFSREKELVGGVGGVGRRVDLA